MKSSLKLSSAAIAIAILTSGAPAAMVRLPGAMTVRAEAGQAIRRRGHCQARDRDRSIVIVRLVGDSTHPGHRVVQGCAEIVPHGDGPVEAWGSPRSAFA